MKSRKSKKEAAVLEFNSKKQISISLDLLQQDKDSPPFLVINYSLQTKIGTKAINKNKRNETCVLSVQRPAKVSNKNITN